MHYLKLPPKIKQFETSNLHERGSFKLYQRCSPGGYLYCLSDTIWKMCRAGKPCNSRTFYGGGFKLRPLLSIFRKAANLTGGLQMVSNATTWKGGGCIENETTWFCKMDIIQLNKQYSEYSLKTMEFKVYEIKDGQGVSAAPSFIMCRLNHWALWEVWQRKKSSPKRNSLSLPLENQCKKSQGPGQNPSV